VAGGCPAGLRCDFSTRVCIPAVQGPHRLYRAQTLAGHAIASEFATRDAVGRAAFGEFHLLVASRAGRYVYVVDSAVVLRVDTSTGWVETLSGLGWPGDVDGPPAVAQFETNFYQNGGIALMPDQRRLVFTSPYAVRQVDVETGEASTIPLPYKPRALAVGRDTGNLYVIDYGPSRMDVLFPDGGSERRAVDAAGGLVGFMAVDEARGVAYGLDRNRQSGALYRWPLDGGTMEWLNHQATGTRDPAQYLSDGPVAGLEMANPAGLSIDADGFVYIGAGDGRTFRRFDPDRGVVESLCRVPSDAGDELFEWCLGDGVRNQPFGTWPAILAFDDSGNGYFGYTVWPRLVALRRLE
jgi:DNA-binding beta-propeller fold protein YncE